MLNLQHFAHSLTHLTYKEECALQYAMGVRIGIINASREMLLQIIQIQGNRKERHETKKSNLANL